ncbi:septum site-determining protein MinC [Shimazuella sp. AN120528]|uniref:septum site-determining protein MinC n=1 Tax=Shimazuella soli TaxID=1892854 RepID=UPI001F0EFBA6|nr:septum site-determining protein MinC [Shimazuella soli]MCH5584048.1 septum site-determining protein MinC [Shimazuella soli]
MAKVVKPSVLIKGTKDGLLFFLDDSLPFSIVLNELKHKLLHENASHIWNGPDMRVQIKLGKRQITRSEEQDLREVFSARKNLHIHTLESDGIPYLLDSPRKMEMLTGTVRSGQVLSHQGDLLLLGDVNPGGCVQSTGNIFILGALRGLAHAGSDGDESVIIAASIFRPTQLRIHNIISRPPDEWKESENHMRFAYIVKEQIAVDKMNHLSHIRPEMEWKEIGRKFG